MCGRERGAACLASVLVCLCLCARAGARGLAGCFRGARAALELYAEWSEAMYAADPNFGEYILSPFGLIGFTEHQARMFLWKHRVPLNPEDKTPKARHCVACAPACASVGGLRAHFARPHRLRALADSTDALLYAIAVARRVGPILSGRCSGSLCVWARCAAARACRSFTCATFGRCCGRASPNSAAGRSATCRRGSSRGLAVFFVAFPIWPRCCGRARACPLVFAAPFLSCRRARPSHDLDVMFQRWAVEDSETAPPAVDTPIVTKAQRPSCCWWRGACLCVCVRVRVFVLAQLLFAARARVFRATQAVLQSIRARGRGCQAHSETYGLKVLCRYMSGAASPVEVHNALLIRPRVCAVRASARRACCALLARRAASSVQPSAVAL
jgi:hypothetical protein